MKRFMYGYKIKNLLARHFWNFVPRYLCEFNGVCDICNKQVGLSDYGYMCRKHGEVYYETKWKYIPKFIFRMCQRHEEK